MKRLVFFDGEAWSPEFNKYLTDESTIISLNNQFKSSNLSYRKIGDYLAKRYEHFENTKTITWLKKKLEKYEKNLMYQGVSLFDLILYGICNNSKYFDSIGGIVNKINDLNKIINIEKPSEIIAIGNSDFIILVNRIAKSRNIYNIIKVESNPVKNLNKFVAPNLIKYYFPLQTFYRRFFERERLNENFCSNYKKIFVPVCGSNYFFPIKPLLKEAEKQKLYFLFVKFEGIYSKQAKTSLESSDVDYKIAEKYLTKDIIRSIKFNLKNINKKWNKLKEDNDFQNSFVYKNINIWSLIKDAFDYFFSRRGYMKELLQNIECVNAVLKTEKPDLCVVVENLTPVSKILMSLSKSNNTPTFYIPHGPFGMFAPFPFDIDRITSWGQYSNDQITSVKTDPKKIVITGSPQMDIIKKLKKEFDKEDICDGLGVDKHKKIIVLATNYLCDPKIVKNVLDSIKDLKDVQLVIKTHPMEPDKRFKSYEKLIKNKINIKIVKDFDLYKLLYISDLVIIFVSTVGIEAMAFDKPVITINFSRLDEHIPFVKSGAALGAYRKEDLKIIIEKGLFNEKIKKNLEKNRKKFLKYMIYKLDGKSTERMMEAIKNFIN